MNFLKFWPDFANSKIPKSTSIWVASAESKPDNTLKRSRGKNIESAQEAQKHDQKQPRSQRRENEVGPENVFSMNYVFWHARVA